MSKRTVFTTVTPLPSSISRETVMETLHSHSEMIDLNPLVEERHPVKPPPNASPEEYHCLWYSITDRVQYLPGKMASGRVSYNACFHDLENGVQTHCYAPMGLNIKGKWTLHGSLPGEPIAPVELGVGAPLTGLYLREDVDMKCNIMMTSFVKKTMKKAHSTLVARLLVKAQIQDASISNQRLAEQTLTPILSQYSGSQTSTAYSPSDYGESPVGAAPQLPPLKSLSFHTPECGGYKQRPDHELFYPQGAGARNSISSYSESLASQGRRTSYQQESLKGNQNSRASYQDPMLQDRRVSWQNLKPNADPIRSPSMHSYHLSNPERSPIQQMAPEFQERNPRRVSAISYHAELPSERAWDQEKPLEKLEKRNPRFSVRPPGYHAPPPQHGHAELE